MKIDFDQPIIDLRTNLPMPMSVDDPKPTTLAVPCVNALWADLPDDAQTPNLKYRAYVIASRIKDGGVVDLDVGDLDFLKKRIERVFGPMIVGQCWNMLDHRIVISEN